MAAIGSRAKSAFSIARAGTLAIDDVVRSAGKVADAPDYAHRHDRVHRGIKPEHVRLQRGHRVAADFGVGKARVADTR